MEYFKTLTTTALAELIKSTKKSLFLCMPSLHAEIVDAIAELNYMENHQAENVKINILVDFDAQTFRQGYGDFYAIEGLFMGGDEIKCLKNNRISFVISDHEGYYLFIESRTMIPADKETINAVRIDPVSMVRLKKFFFPDENNYDYNNELTDAVIEESITLSKPENLIPEKPAPVAEIRYQEIRMVKQDLERNPPLNPDYKRIVQYYTNKFQYVKLKFEGANLVYRKIEIPNNALPISDSALKNQLETKLNLFNRADQDRCFKSLNDFKAKISEFRERYLTKLKSREESLLDKNQKTDFESELKSFSKEIIELKKETINQLALQIESTKKRLLTDLNEFFIANPKALLPDHPYLWQGNEDYIQYEAQSKSEEVIHKIKWHKAHMLVDEFKLTAQYSDITFEDLKSEEFIKELAECKLINEADMNQLAEFGKGVILNN